MDFVPGYRLIRVDDFALELGVVATQLNILGVIPFLSNDSSDYIGVGTDEAEGVYSVVHDSPDVVIMHSSPEKFFETLCSFYRGNAYFLDDDGFLDYDYERVSAIGAALNPGLVYWAE